MTWFRNLRIGMKLGFGFGLILTLAVMVGGFSLLELSRVNDEALEIANNWLPSIRDLGEIRFQVAAARRWGLNHIISEQSTRMDEAETHMRKTLDTIASVEQKYEPGITSDEERRLYTDFRNNWDKYLAINSRVMELSRQGKKKEATDLNMSEGLEAFNAATEKIDEDVVFNDNGGKKAATQAAEVYSSGRYWVIGLLIGTIALGIVIATAIARAMAGAATVMLGMIQQVAANNLAIEDMEGLSEDEIGQAGMALNQMKNSLHNVVQSISDTAEHVATASEELSSTSQQISTNSEETSAQAGVVSQAILQVTQNLQSVSTGSEEMTSTIQSIASNSHEAATVASNAVQTAQSANTTVAKLGDSSAEIGEVIKVITSIAQQTNLLALNATIEAARAGEAGKGFAVVANEVKELAKQTAKATEDISRKITAIQTDTKGAVEAIGKITGVISQVNDISGTIATAVEEQSATTNEMTRNVADAAKASGEISHNINGVADAARGTSNSAQESQKAANELAEMAMQLRNLVTQFKLNASSGVAAHSRGRARAARSGV